MKIHLLSTLFGHTPGDTIEVSETLGKGLIASGRASAPQTPQVPPQASHPAIKRQQAVLRPRESR
jgi:hypothetical protein